MEMNSMERGNSFYHFNHHHQESSNLYMNVIELKGPDIRHKFRTSKQIRIEVDPLITSPNITFDFEGDYQ